MKTTLRCLAVAGLGLLTSAGCGHRSNHQDSDASQANSPTQAPVAPVDKTAEYENTRARITDLEAQRDKALTSKDAATFARVSLELNHQNDLLALLGAGETDPAKFAAVDAKYKQLSSLLATELAQGTPPGSTTSTTHPDTHLPRSPLVYNPVELTEMNRIFHDFGDLYINEGPAQELKLDFVPWAGYWYAYSNTSAYQGDSAPLVKLDRVLTKLTRPKADTAPFEAALVGSANNYDTDEGHCAAWAAAAITSKEPTKPVTFQGETFTAADQKLLLLETREAWQTTTQYGVRYTGHETDGLGQEMRPEAWHRIVQVMLGERHQSFFFNRDPGPAVWMVPIVSYRSVVARDPSKSNAYLVNAQVTFTSFREDVTDDPTTQDDIHQMQFDYRLYVDPSQEKDGKFKVIAGEWLAVKEPVSGIVNDSFNHHPNTATVVKLDGKPKSFNEEINKNLDVIAQILGQ